MPYNMPNCPMCETLRNRLVDEQASNLGAENDVQRLRGQIAVLRRAADDVQYEWDALKLSVTGARSSDVEAMDQAVSRLALI